MSEENTFPTCSAEARTLVRIGDALMITGFSFLLISLFFGG